MQSKKLKPYSKKHKPFKPNPDLIVEGPKGEYRPHVHRQNWHYHFVRAESLRPRQFKQYENGASELGTTR